MTSFANECKIFAGTVLLLGLSLQGFGQQLEPGAYSVSPVGVNIFVFTYNFSGGDLNFDPSLPIEDAEATVNTVAFSYIRSLNVLGRSANVGISLPLTTGTVQGYYIGEFTTVDRLGLRDPYIRFAVNLFGAPAMELKEFARYRQKTNIGFSTVIVPPLGQYVLRSSSISGRTAGPSNSKTSRSSARRFGVREGCVGCSCLVMDSQCSEIYRLAYVSKNGNYRSDGPG
jgi:hypothetical protein